MSKSIKPQILPAVLSILIAQSAGFIGSIFTAESVNSWYNTLNKPIWNPPSWVFGPIWIILYTLMGIAAYLVWQNKEKQEIKIGLYLYSIQLGLNTLWSFIFFGMRDPKLALLEIIILFIFIVGTTIAFFKVNKKAGYLMLPYIAWVAFASLLNCAIFRLN